MCEGARSAKTLGEQKTQVARAAARARRVKRRCPRPDRRVRSPVTPRAARRVGSGDAREARVRRRDRRRCGSMRQKRDPRRCRARGRDRRCDEPARPGGARGVATRGGHAWVAADIRQMSGRLAPCSLTRLKRALLKGRAASRGRHLHQEDSTSSEKTRGRLLSFCPLLVSRPTVSPVSNTNFKTGPQVKLLVRWFGVRLPRLGHPNDSKSRNSCFSHIRPFGPSLRALIGRDRDDGRRGPEGSLPVCGRPRTKRAVGRGAPPMRASPWAGAFTSSALQLPAPKTRIAFSPASTVRSLTLPSSNAGPHDVPTATCSRARTSSP